MPFRIADVLRSVAYLLVSFPLGVLYFTLLTGVVAAGVSLLVFVVGVLVLAGGGAVARRVALVDAALAARLYGTPRPDLPGPSTDGGLLETALAELTHPSGYRSAAYLFVRFVVGVAAFVYLVTWASLSAALLSAPALYDDPNYTVGVVGVWEVQSLGVALAVAAVGVAVAVVGAVVVAAVGRTAARASALVLTAGRD